MPDNEQLQIFARIAAHERIIRDLLVTMLMRAEHPLAAFDLYAGTLRGKLFHATLEGNQGPAMSDLMNQLISESIDETLSGVRGDILKLAQEYQ